MVSVIEHQKVARRRKRPVSSPARPYSGASPGRVPENGEGRSRSRFRYGASLFSLRGLRFRDGAGIAVAALERRGIDLRRSRRGNFLSVFSSQFGLAAEEFPVLVAAVIFAVFVNVLLLSFRSDRIILSGAVSGISPPPAQELVIQSRLAPRESEFAVIGEVAGVDPSQFARLEVVTYTVQRGDTLGEIALEHGLDIDTLISFNQIEDVRRLQAGSTMEIPNRNGLLYTVKSGDSLSAIASRHGTTVNTVLDANDMRSQALDVGQVIFVPNAKLNETERRIILGELFAWPTRGTFTSGFGMRADPFTGYPRFHNGIDLANNIGTPIRAAASGRVVHVESQIGNYGRFVILRHPDGFQTLYAHLDTFSVRNGQYVDRGAVLGSMGNTGRSTGPHLHFSVIHNGTFVDPLRYLH